MAISRERANDLSHRILEGLRKTPGVEVAAEAEFVRNRVAAALGEWERESDALAAEARKRVLARGRRVAEGSREFDQLLSEELRRLWDERATRGE
ncbi:MAG: DUF507 family protein [Thermoanaerobaculia bacterium]